MTTPFVLLVDDEVPFVETVAERLDIREIKTVTAFNGKECLEALKTHKTLDVIVLDYKMPEMDGLETLKEIKKAAPLAEVIMLTGHVTMESANELMERGAYDYMIKPLDIEALVAKVEAAVAKKRKREEKIKDVLEKQALLQREP